MMALAFLSAVVGLAVVFLEAVSISKELIYSEAHIYRILRQIKKKLRSLGRDFIYEPKEK